ncbi:hypothetical protein ACA910_017430 [Epithemia clementina (nom. ined.)]
MNEQDLETAFSCSPDDEMVITALAVPETDNYFSCLSTLMTQSRLDAAFVKIGPDTQKLEHESKEVSAKNDDLDPDNEKDKASQAVVAESNTEERYEGLEEESSQDQRNYQGNQGIA